MLLRLKRQSLIFGLAIMRSCHFLSMGSRWIGRPLSNFWVFSIQTLWVGLNMWITVWERLSSVWIFSAVCGNFVSVPMFWLCLSCRYCEWLTLSITVWYGSTTVDEKRKIARVIRTASQIIGIKLNSADEIYRQRTLARAHSITKDGSHPANALFQMMRRKYRSLPGRTKRSNRSFYNTAVRYLNGNFN